VDVKNDKTWKKRKKKNPKLAHTYTFIPSHSQVYTYHIACAQTMHVHTHKHIYAFSAHTISYNPIHKEFYERLVTIR